MRVLLIWKNIPESVEQFVIDDPTEEELAVLKAAAGKYFDSFTDNNRDEVRPVWDRISFRDECCSVPGGDHNCQWRDLEQKSGLLEGPFDLVVTTGWYL